VGNPFVAVEEWVIEREREAQCRRLGAATFHTGMGSGQNQGKTRRRLDAPSP
jgi:hypothetical protein